MKLPTAIVRRDATSMMLACIASASFPCRPAFAKYGEFANMPATPGGDFAAGDKNNECLFAQPGTGVCQVYKSSEPALWATPDTSLALGKLIKAANGLDGIGGLISKSQWTAIGQALGASRDLREAVGFLTTQSGSKEAALLAKKVFATLDGIALATQKKDAAAAKTYFAKYETTMPDLIRAVTP
jgi:hypothetical protein